MLINEFKNQKIIYHLLIYKNCKIIIYIKCIIILLLILLLLLFYLFFAYFNNKNINSKKFRKYFPKISLDNNTIPSLNDIFNSRELFIPESNLTREYIKYIRPINETEEEKYKKNYSKKAINFSQIIFKKRKDQYNYIEFAKICLKEKLIDSYIFEYDNRPAISIVLPSFNKENMIMKSIRSIQNQSFKNIEIIIINDCSTDNSTKYFKYLLQTDPRIRIFTHLKNMGCWRTRLDGILYSRGKYIISFDTGDLYEDNYVLEDAFNVIEKYNLDSIKFLFRVIRSFNTIDKSNIFFHVNNNSKIEYESSGIEKFNKFIFKGWENIWNRLVRANIYIKGIHLLNDLTLNIYKNFWEDIWCNKIINKVSDNFLVIERIGYIYLYDGQGFGNIKSRTESEKDKLIKEFLGFLYFDYNMLPKNNNKKIIIIKLLKYNSNTNFIKLSYLKTQFHILNNLLDLLIEDPYVAKDDKILLNRLLIESKKRENKILIRKNNI